MLATLILGPLIVLLLDGLVGFLIRGMRFIRFGSVMSLLSCGTRVMGLGLS